jgi:malonyl-CoA O-methyltransferase
MSADPLLIEVVPTETGYDKWASIYDHEDNPLILLEEQHMGQIAGDVSGLQVADIGSGTGRQALRLAAAGATVTALDFSESMLARARAKPGAEQIRFICHDLGRPLPLSDAAFDRVFCCLVLDHIAKPEELFSELKRICRRDGSIIISVMHPTMMLRGVQARFTDPDSGRKVGPQSFPNQISDYVMGAIRAGLVIEHLSEHAVAESLANRSPRAAKYLGWPMLLLMRLRHA